MKASTLLHWLGVANIKYTRELVKYLNDEPNDVGKVYRQLSRLNYKTKKKVKEIEAKAAAQERNRTVRDCKCGETPVSH